MRKVSPVQLEMLLSYLERHPDLNGRGGNLGAEGNSNYKAKWEQLATHLNSAGVGCIRTGAKWRDYWNERKYAARRRAEEIRKRLRSAGGSLPRVGSWSSIDQRILAVAGMNTTFGLVKVRSPVNLGPTGTSQSQETVPSLGPSASPPPTFSQSLRNQSPPSQFLIYSVVSRSPSPQLAPKPTSPPLPPKPTTPPLLPRATTPLHPPRHNTQPQPPPPPTTAVNHKRSWRRPRRSEPIDSPFPRWMRSLEERRIVVEERRVAAQERQTASFERNSAALESMSTAVKNMSGVLTRLESLLVEFVRSCNNSSLGHTDPN